PRASPRFFGMIRSAPYTSGMGRLLTTLTAALVLFAASPAWAGPTDQRRAPARNIAHEPFDISESAQRVLARHWQARTPAERDEFTQLFADLLERTYIARLDEYGGERMRYGGAAVSSESG